MQRIMIVSDTHRRLGNLVEILDREGEIDLLIHLGDYEGDDEAIMEMAGCEVHIVPGNNDFFSPYDQEKEIFVGDKKILLTHGHYSYVSLDLATIREEAIARGADIVMFGHTHRPVIIEEDEITLINPGSISYPRQSGRECTYIMMEVADDGKITYDLRSV